MKNRNKNIVGVLAGIIVMTVFCSSVWATHSLPGSGWIQITDDRGDTGSTGGQPYDHEYMAWKIDGSNLSIGIQSGFDLVDGINSVSGPNNDWYLGDLALSFDGDKTYNGSSDTGYEYAFDYGLYTRDKDQYNVDADTDGRHSSGNGIDSPGLWDVTTWNTHNSNSAFPDEKPLGMDGGSEVLAANGTTSALALGNIDGEGNSYYRIATFDISALAGLEDVIFNPDG